MIYLVVSLEKDFDFSDEFACCEAMQSIFYVQCALISLNEALDQLNSMKNINTINPAILVLDSGRSIASKIIR